MGRITDIPYGDKTIRAELPDHTFNIPAGGLRQLEPIKDLEGTVKEALFNPLGS